MINSPMMYSGQMPMQMPMTSQIPTPKSSSFSAGSIAQIIIILIVVVIIGAVAYTIYGIGTDTGLFKVTSAVFGATATLLDWLSNNPILSILLAPILFLGWKLTKAGSEKLVKKFSKEGKAITERTDLTKKEKEEKLKEKVNEAIEERREIEDKAVDKEVAEKKITYKEGEERKKEEHEKREKDRKEAEKEIDKIEHTKK